MKKGCFDRIIPLIRLFYNLKWAFISVF